MYKTYSYNDMPTPVKRRNDTVKKPPAPRGTDVKREAAVEKKKDIKPVRDVKKNNDNGIFDNLENDDIILIAVALVLLMDGCDDKLLLLAIAFVFLSDKI